MKEKLNKIIFVSLSLITIACLGYSTFVYVSSKNIYKKYVLNNNEKYLISDYKKIIDDVNIYGENLLVQYYSLNEMEIENNYITTLHLTFVDESNSNYYYLRIDEKGNTLNISKAKEEIKKCIPIDYYFNACYLGYKELESNICCILSYLALEDTIYPEEDNYFYLNSNINSIIDPIDGPFFLNQLEDDSEQKNIDVYIKF